MGYKRQRTIQIDDETGEVFLTGSDMQVLLAGNYGLGGTEVELTSDDDLHNLPKETCFYYTAGDVPDNYPESAHDHSSIIYLAHTNSLNQSIILLDSNNDLWTKGQSSGKWTDWKKAGAPTWQ